MQLPGVAKGELMIDFDLLVDIEICTLLGLIVGVMVIAMARVLEREKAKEMDELERMFHCSEGMPRRLK